MRAGLSGAAGILAALLTALAVACCLATLAGGRSDRGGAGGVTAAQRARAERLVAVTRRRLPTFADVATAETGQGRRAAALRSRARRAS